jgi:predicted Zn finger-like uncharacterized protein
MRLTCPNCDALYEVPDDVIPAEGRDVECSNCGQTWFQPHPDHAAEHAASDDSNPDAPSPDEEWVPEVDDAPDSEPPAPEPAADPTPPASTENPDAAKAARFTEGLEEIVKDVIRREVGQVVDKAVAETPEQDEDDFEAALDAKLEEDASEAPVQEQPPEVPEVAPVAETMPERVVEEDPFEQSDDFDARDEQLEALFEDQEDIPPARKRRQLDPAITDVLREEAELENARRAEETGLESQPDLGLEEPEDDAAKRAREARARMARMRGLSEDAQPAEAAPAPANSRRDLLPDIEEINSTLRSTEDRTQEEMPGARPSISQRRAGGNRIGFALAILLLAGAFFVYMQPGKVTTWMPQSDRVVAGYVNAVDGGRLWLDARMTTLMLWLDGMASEAGGNS